MVKALYIDRGLVFCHGKYGLCPFSKTVSVSEHSECVQAKWFF